jgi:hypothetical protein
VELGGKELKDGAEFAQILYQTFEEKPVVAMVAARQGAHPPGNQIEMAPRAEPVTARVRAQYLPELQEVEVVSRAIAQMKVTLPESWLPGQDQLEWHRSSQRITRPAAGCWMSRRSCSRAKRCQ